MGGQGQWIPRNAVPQARVRRSGLPYAVMTMGLGVAPKIEVSADQVRGTTPWIVQLAILFTYSRSVLIDRRREVVVVTTRWFWFWTTRRTIPFRRVSRIIYRAQGLPSLSPMRYMSLAGWDWYNSAVFLIAIAIPVMSSPCFLFGSSSRGSPTGSTNWRACGVTLTALETSPRGLSSNSCASTSACPWPHIDKKQKPR